MLSINCSGYDIHEAAMMCGQTLRKGETEIDAVRRDCEGHRRLRLIAAHEVLVLSAALEKATAAKSTAADIWDALCDLRDAHGVLHKDHVIKMLRTHGLP